MKRDSALGHAVEPDSEIRHFLALRIDLRRRGSLAVPGQITKGQTCTQVTSESECNLRNFVPKSEQKHRVPHDLAPHSATLSGQVRRVRHGSLQYRDGNAMFGDGCNTVPVLRTTDLESGGKSSTPWDRDTREQYQGRMGAATTRFYPGGVVSRSPGSLAKQAHPGCCVPTLTSKVRRWRSIAILSMAADAIPLGLGRCSSRHPRVPAAREPWGAGFDPFGVKTLVQGAATEEEGRGNRCKCREWRGTEEV